MKRRSEGSSRVQVCPLVARIDACPTLGKLSRHPASDRSDRLGSQESRTRITELGEAFHVVHVTAVSQGIRTAYFSTLVPPNDQARYSDYCCEQSSGKAEAQRALLYVKRVYRRGANLEGPAGAPSTLHPAPGTRTCHPQGL